MRVDKKIFHLCNKDVLKGVREIHSLERKVQAEYIAYLVEIERRELHLELGYSSMFRFVVEELGHSESEALKRIQIARVAARFPKMFDLISENKMSLSALCLLCPHLDHANFDSLTMECSGKTVRKVEEILATHFPDRKSDKKDSVKSVSEDDVLVQFHADKEFTELLEKAKARLSHKYPKAKLSDIFGEALRLLVEEKQPKSKREVAVQADAPHSRYIPQGILAEVWTRDNGKCCFVSPITEKRCNETKWLEIDHVRPFALGGTSRDPENLRLVCRNHNQFFARKTFHWDRREKSPIRAMVEDSYGWLGQKQL
jgi:hypothetical protein